ncbi:CPBP family intramembrane glutamic endopeptidase [Streptosporangium sp. NPDC023825]|uniref:CPBP family intramembrane glutamic endopeptidase n=1 Tax=Streptosporangium sp. NPDC023825 TaxID=3154909 RepID=UPI00343EA977
MLRRSPDLWLFLLIAFGLSWLFTLPLWLSDAPTGTLTFTLIGVAMMFTPTLGVLAVRLRGRRLGDPATGREWAVRTGLSAGGSRGRTLALVALAWFGIPALVVVAIALSAALGLLSVDLREFSLFRETLAAAAPGGPPPAEIGALVAVQAVSMVLIVPVVNSAAAFGEEWGWRGWMLPRLTPLGTWRALLVSGVIWGLWHFPLTLRGYNYPELGAWAAPMFVVFCVTFGALLGWLRLYSGSVWPAVVGHGSLNSSAGLMLLIGDAADPPVFAVAGITGLVGSALMAVVSALLFKYRPVERPVPVAAG